MSNKSTTQPRRTLLSQQQLEALIESYFEGTTTPSDEMELRWQLAHTPHRSNTIDEAAAVMSYFAMASRHEQQRQRTLSRRRMLTSAAAVALALSAGTAAVAILNRPNGECYAYVNGKRVDSVEVVLDLIDAQTELFSRLPLATDPNPVTTQLSALREALENDQ